MVKKEKKRAGKKYIEYVYKKKIAHTTIVSSSLVDVWLNCNSFHLSRIRKRKKKRGIFTRRRCVGAEIQNHAQFCSCFVKCMFKYRDKRDISRAIVVSGNILGTKRHRYQKSFSVLSGEKWMQFKLSMGVSYRKVINLLCNNKLTDFQFVKYVMILCLVSVFVLTKLFDFVMLLIT